MSPLLVIWMLLAAWTVAFWLGYNSARLRGHAAGFPFALIFTLFWMAGMVIGIYGFFVAGMMR